MKVYLDDVEVKWPSKIRIEVDKPGESVPRLEILLTGGGSLFVVGDTTEDSALTIKRDEDTYICLLSGEHAGKSLEELMQLFPFLVELT